MRIIDLTHPLKPGAPCFPGDPTLSLEAWATIAREGYQLTKVCFGSHLGTHLDAPRHYLGEGLSVDRMPVEWFYGPATAIRLPVEPEASIDVSDLEPFQRHFQPEARVLIDTGWHRRYGSAEFYQRYPSLTSAACEWIAECRIRLLGLDTPSPSHESVRAHHVLLGANIVILESLANLSEVPERFLLSALPLPFEGIDGSPVRAVAVVDEPNR